MIKTALNLTVPMFAMAGGEMYGINAGVIGSVALLIMIACVIANQVWALADRWRNSVRNPETDTSFFTDACGRYRREIGRTLDQLRQEDARQDALNKDRFDKIDQSIKSMRMEVREDNKEVTHRLDTMTSAVGELIGRTKQ